MQQLQQAALCIICTTSALSWHLFHCTRMAAEAVNTVLGRDAGSGQDRGMQLECLAESALTFH